MAQFRAKARAVDLLGKGQIADLPTAISELWKNGYDAYGDKLEAYLYMKGYKNQDEPIFVLSDDGKGMNREDILDKWFVLGTDSKSHHIADKKGPETTLGKEPRVKMGEKGIGRLAVAYLGPQMLMLTKKQNNPLEIVFFDWRVLENFELFLSDVNIPLKTIESTKDFQSVLEKLKEDFLFNFPEIKDEDKGKEKDPWKDQQELKESIINDCKTLTVPSHIIDSVIKDLVENPTKSHSTRFIVFQPDQQILDLKNFTKKDENEDLRDDNTVNHTVSALVGLFNLFKNTENSKKTSFWIYNEDGPFDLLNFKSFFIPEDFNNCDHLISGRFDEEGSFEGNVRIYKKEISHSFKPVKKKARTHYGAFNIRLGYVAGKETETSLNPEQYKIFGEKLDLYGGLYIYRDGFRVLPYGRAENDFLEFEERRGKHAGSAFFAKRRMFGYIEITRADNPKLTDKSSREGFVNNIAYRDFKSDLIAFFKDLARKYFGTEAESDYKETQKEELKKLAIAEANEKQRDILARKEFAGKLNHLPKDLEIFQKEYSDLLKELDSKVNASDMAYDEVQSLISRIEECKVKIADFKIAKPTRFKPTDLQKKNFNSYDKQYQNAVKTLNNSSDILSKVRDKLKVHELFKEFESKNILYQNTLSNQFSEFESRLDIIFNKINDEFKNEKDVFILDFNSKYKDIIPAKNDAKEISRSMKLLESIFNDSRERINNRVAPYLLHLERINFEVNEDDLVGFYKIQFEEMKEEWNKTYELAQLGIAVEIIDHQFNTLYSQLAENIKTMERHLINNKEAKSQYKTLSSAFEHLEDNYKLLQPLYRTTGRIRKDVTGKELSEYINDFFKNRFEENKINFHITKEAETWTAYSYESIFKPVLINIINNAIYWLQPADKREIKIDVKDNKLLIMNSGVPIDESLEKSIFELFYSERPKGRGIGLYLAKKSLNGIGFNIEASNDEKYNRLRGASFIIYPVK